MSLAVSSYYISLPIPDNICLPTGLSLLPQFNTVHSETVTLLSCFFKGSFFQLQLRYIGHMQRIPSGIVWPHHGADCEHFMLTICCFGYQRYTNTEAERQEWHIIRDICLQSSGMLQSCLSYCTLMCKSVLCLLSWFIGVKRTNAGIRKMCGKGKHSILCA